MHTQLFNSALCVRQCSKKLIWSIKAKSKYKVSDQNMVFTWIDLDEKLVCQGVDLESNPGSAFTRYLCLSLENHCLKSKTQVKLIEGFTYRVKEFQAYGIEYFSLFP